MDPQWEFEAPQFVDFTNLDNEDEVSIHFIYFVMITNCNLPQFLIIYFTSRMQTAFSTLTLLVVGLLSNSSLKVRSCVTFYPGSVIQKQ